MSDIVIMKTVNIAIFKFKDSSFLIEKARVLSLFVGARMQYEIYYVPVLLIKTLSINGVIE